MPKKSPKGYRLYRREYLTKEGAKEVTDNFWIRFRDHLHTVQRWPLDATTENVAGEICDRILKLVLRHALILG